MVRRDGSRRKGWDPLLIVSQIIALQACHYLILALITPPLLVMFANPLSLSLEGGASNVAMIMDWREMVGRATIEDKIGDYTRLPPSLGRHRPSTDNIDSQREQARQVADTARGGQQDWQAKIAQDASQDTEPDPEAEQAVEDFLRRPEGVQQQQHQMSERYYAADPARGWVLGVAWIAASSLDIFYIYHLIRRPTHILDFSLTLVLIHTVLTTYYASSFPTSLFFWAVIAGSAALQIIWAEQLCVKREMKEGFILGQGWKLDERPEDGPGAQSTPARRQRRNSAPSAFRTNSGNTMPSSSKGKPGYESIPMVDVGS